MNFVKRYMLAIAAVALLVSAPLIAQEMNQPTDDPTTQSLQAQDQTGQTPDPMETEVEGDELETEVDTPTGELETETDLETGETESDFDDVDVDVEDQSGDLDVDADLSNDLDDDTVEADIDTTDDQLDDGSDELPSTGSTLPLAALLGVSLLTGAAVLRARS